MAASDIRGLLDRFMPNRGTMVPGAGLGLLDMAARGQTLKTPMRDRAMAAGEIPAVSLSEHALTIPDYPPPGLPAGLLPQAGAPGAPAAGGDPASVKGEFAPGIGGINYQWTGTPDTNPNAALPGPFSESVNDYYRQTLTPELYQRYILGRP